jgi:hypothetical protein
MLWVLFIFVVLMLAGFFGEGRLEAEIKEQRRISEGESNE